MFNTVNLFQLHKEDQAVKKDKPFGSEIFAMMAATTFGLASGGPDRMYIDQRNVSTNLEQAHSPVAGAGEDDVKGWLFYDPSTEDFRQSSIDEEVEEEQVAAQALVDVCDQAFEASPATTCGCEQEEEDLGLLRSSFSFHVLKECDVASPAVSPFSVVHGSLDTDASTATGCDAAGDDMREAGSSGHSPANNDDYPATSSHSPPNNKGHGGNMRNSSLHFFPPLRGTRLSSHRGSVMEAGVVLDARVFGGIGIVQIGRNVDVMKSVSAVRLKTAGALRE